MNRISGYEPESKICWQFRNKGDTYRTRERWGSWSCRCPVCSTRDRAFVTFGRCRSGQRWFWWAVNNTLSYKTKDCTDVVEKYGFADSEEQAWAAVRAAVRELSADKLTVAVVAQSTANDKLKEINLAKRRGRPLSDATESKVVEYLYGYKGCQGLSRSQIVKKTAKRICYLYRGEEIDDHGDPIVSKYNIRTSDTRDTTICYLNRQKLEANGHVHSLCSSLEGYLKDWRRAEPDALDLRQLKQAMADAHPDRGGTNAAFIEARARYNAARKMLRWRQGQ